MKVGISKRSGPRCSKCGLGQVGLVSLGSSVEIQNLRDLPDLLKQRAHYKIPRSFVGTTTFEKH